MRNAFAKQLEELARVDPRVVLISGDIGNRMFDQFKAIAPDRFINAGIAEQNMIGVAAGLAMNGFRPFVYTITPFVTTRCMEQIRVDLCYHNLPVVIAGVGGGLSYASLGATHHSCEDVAMLRSLPNMTVMCPGDAVEVSELMEGSLGVDGPMYLRLGKKNEPVIHEKKPNLRIGFAHVLRNGADICVLSTGNVLPMADKVAKVLCYYGVSATLASMHTVKPLDKDYLRWAFEQHRLVISIEEHSRIGGLGSAVDQWMSENDPAHREFIGFGTDDKFAHGLGSQAYVRGVLGLDLNDILMKTVKHFQVLTPEIVTRVNDQLHLFTDEDVKS